MADQGDKTVREPVVSNGGVTVREGQSPVANVTLREGQAAGATVREGQPAAARPAAKKTSDFRGYAIRKQLPSNSTEADIYIVEKDGAYYVLKLYRYGIEPKRNILQKIKVLSQTHPHEFIRVFEVDYDSRFKRWFEIQEYARYGTLQAFMERLANITDTQRANFVNLVAREVGQALSLLHQNELLHLDIKPSNILVRSPKWPYDLVLIDFGIATALSADMSKKFTQTRGTPMYQSPESWVGSMGRPSDWWGLGMILLEIAAGAHPFAGLNQNVIASAIATRPVAIPDNLEAGQKELIRGLLTRDPAKRWSWEQVSRWLKGERGIPQFFEAEEPAKIEAPASDVKPLVFMGQPCHSLVELAAAFAKDEEGWEKGKAFLMRGYVTRWLEEIGDYDASADMDVAISGAEDTDEKTFRFVQQFGKDIPFAFGGHLITLQNLLIIAGKVLKREPVSTMEQKIADSISDGRLLSCLEFFIKKAKANEEMETLLAALRNLKDKTTGDVVGFLDFYLNPQNYYAPFVEGASSVKDVVQASAGITSVPMRMEQWEKIEKLIKYSKNINERDSDGKTILMKAAEENAADAVRVLIERGADVHARQKNDTFSSLSYGTTALMLAAEKNAVDAMRVLIEHGANVNATNDNDRTAIVYAAWKNAVDAIKLLIDHGANVNAEVLSSAAWTNAVDAVKILIEYGVDVNAKDNYNRTALMKAASNDAADAIKVLIEHGADVNAEGNFGTALGEAAQYNAVKAIDVLLEHGADVNAGANRGNTAIMKAADGNAADAIKVLIEHGAKVDSKEDYYGNGTALMKAAYSDAVDAIKVLIEYGADVNEKDNSGETALIKAVSSWKICLGAIKVLLENGADVNAKDNYRYQSD